MLQDFTTLDAQYGPRVAAHIRYGRELRNAAIRDAFSALFSMPGKLLRRLAARGAQRDATLRGGDLSLGSRSR